jgi:hypothetical protein
MIVSRDDVLRDLAWSERVAFVGASAATREMAAARVPVLRQELHRIEEKRRVLAAARSQAWRWKLVLLAFFLTFIAGAVAHAQWPRVALLLGHR